jgi:hypothetical protein
MSQHHKLVYGSLFVFFAATHAGCAGGSLKNVFTRNETDGYHSLDELETEEESVTESDVSADEAEKTSMATRLASWRPFSKAEPTEEETLAAGDAETSDAEDAGRSPRFLGRAFGKREVVEPDPFLSAEPKLADEAESPAINAAPESKIAKSDNKSTTAEDEFVMGSGRKPKSGKDAAADIRQVQQTSESNDAVALGAARKPEATASHSADDDDALAKRFEQHFLLNSVGTLAKAESDAAATAKDLGLKTASKAETKKREVSRIADRQIDNIDFLLASDPAPSGKNSGLRRHTDTKPLEPSTRSDSTVDKFGTSLAAFDQLMGTEVSDATRDEIPVKHKVTQPPRKKAAALDINVADAEALFGAAAARQNTRLKQPESAHRMEELDRHVAGSSAWSQGSDNSEGFSWDDASQEKSGTQSDGNRDDVANAFARYAQVSSGPGKGRTQNPLFGAPPASAGNVEGDDDSPAEPHAFRLSSASTSSSGHRIVAANFGSARPIIVGDSAGTGTSVAGDAQFTAAPVAPVSQLEPTSETVSAAARPGLVQSFSTRNWLLLIGGVIVIALLFAPGRTKPLTMNGRPANV